MLWISHFSTGLCSRSAAKCDAVSLVGMSGSGKSESGRRLGCG